MTRSKASSYKKKLPGLRKTGPFYLNTHYENKTNETVVIVSKILRR